MAQKTDANIGIGISGIQQFKADIKAANNSLKTMNAQMALNEKQFKATGDAETYMQERSELLKAKLEEQKAVVNMAEKALEQMAAGGISKTNAEYQEMQRNLIKAKSDMIDTEAAMAGISDTGDEAANNIETMNSQLRQIGNGISYQNVIDGLSSITGGMQKVMTKAWQMGEAIVKATLGAGSWADELKTTAAQYEISPEELQRMRKTANLIDTDVDTIITAQQKMRQGIGKGDKEAMGAFVDLLGEGYDPTAQKGIDNFWAAGRALMALDDENKKQVYSQKLFGRSWRELIPLFTAGREEYEKTMDSWSVVSEDQLDSLGKMDDQYQKMQGEFESFKMEMLSAFSGPMTEGMETITGLFKELNSYLQTPEGQAMIAQIGETVSGLIKDLTAIDPESVVNGLKSVIDGITDSLKWISENKNGVVTAMEGIVAGWGLLKLSGGALKVLELVNGLKDLKGTPSIELPGTTPTTPAAPTAAPAADAAGAAGTGAAAAKTGGGAWGFWSLIAAAGYAGYEVLKNIGDAKRANPEAFRGTDESLKEQSAGAEETLTEWIKVNQRLNDMNNLMYMSGEEYEALQKRAEELNRKLEETEEGVKAKNAYSDWKQENSLNDKDWVIPEALDKLNKTAEELSGTGEQQQKSSGDLSSAATTLKGMGSQVESAILRGMAQIKVYIDGHEAGQALSPHVSAAMAGALGTLSK